MAESLRGDVYTLELAEEHIADLRGSTDILGEAHAQNDVTDYPATPSSGHIMFAAAGHMKYVSGTTGDGVTYNTGRNTNAATSALSLTTSMQTVPGLSLSLGVGTYRVHAQLLVNPPGAAGGTLSYQLSGSGGLTASNGRFSVVEANGAGGNNSGNVAADYNTLGNSVNGTSPNGAANRIVTIDGLLIISVAGTLNVQAQQAATANATIVQYGTYVETFPVT